MIAKKRRRRLALVIEDEAGIRNLVARVLSLEGFDVLEAADGERGLELVHQNSCDVVILDLGLPGRDGWSVLKEMKEEPGTRDVPVIVFTASAEVSLREKARDMLAADYLVKPSSTTELRSSVARALTPPNETA